MKRFFFILTGACLLGAGGLRSAEPPPIQLKGIVSFSTNRFALLENVPPGSFMRELIFSEGKRDESFEVVKIDVPSEKVTIKQEGIIRELTFPEAASPGAPQPLDTTAFLRLHQTSLSHVFEVYQRLARRSLVRTLSLAAPDMNLVAGGGSGADLAAAVEKALAKTGIVVRPDGDKFAVAAKEGEPGKITPELMQLASGIVEHRNSSSPADTTIPAGTIRFLALDLSQFLPVYQELSGRTILRPSSLRTAPIAFTTHTSLTLTEAIYALSAVLAVNDISVLPLDEKFLVVFPTAETNKVSALLSRKPLTHEVSNKNFPGTIEFRQTNLRDVIAFYQELSGQPVEIEDGVASLPIVLKTQTALTREEALRGLEMVLSLNGLTVVQQEDGHGLKVVGMAQR